MLSKEMQGSDVSNEAWTFNTTEGGNKLVSFVLGLYGIIVYCKWQMQNCLKNLVGESEGKKISIRAWE